MNSPANATVDLPASKAKRRTVRRLTAVIAVDVCGYSALMGRDEEDTHRRVGAEIGRITKEVNRLQGRVFSVAGDGLMAELPSAVDVVKCALRIQADAGRRNAKLPTDRRIDLRIGINSGEIVVQSGRLGGTAVNVAARLEQLAEPGGICLAGVVFDQVKYVVAADYFLMGERRLKNIRDPVLVYTIPAASCLFWVAPPAPEPRTAPTLIEARPDYRPSLAVLPFRTVQRNQRDAYFAEGMVDDIIRILGGLKDLIVVSRSSTLGYTGVAPDVQRIGHELDVQYVLRGGVRRAGSEIRIAVELDDAKSRQSIWADTFDGNVAEMFDLQERIALQTASSIAPHVREREIRRAFSKDQNSVTAYDLTLRALDLIYRMDRQALARAQEMLERAVPLDLSYSAALSHLAYLHLFRIGQGWSQDEHADRLAAVQAASRAVERDRSDALGLAIEAHLQGYLRRNPDLALAALDRAVAIDPSCALAWTFKSLTSGILGDAEAALIYARKALRLSPVGPDAGCWHEHALSQAHYLAGQFSDAVAWGRKAALHGNQQSNLRCLAASLVAVDELDEARNVALRILETKPDFTLRGYRSYTPLQGQIVELFIERLRRAGLPD